MMSIYTLLSNYLNTINETGVVSEYNPKHRTETGKDLSNFKLVKIDKRFISKHKEDISFLRKVNPIEKGWDSVAWMDGETMVAILSVNPEHRSGYRWISAIEINEPYRGYGLAPKILDHAVNIMKSEALSVNVSNKVALKIYEKYGFKTIPESLRAVKAGESKMYHMYLNYQGAR